MLMTVLFFSVCSFLDTKDKRYTMKMFPVIPKEKWRKGSQVFSNHFDLLRKKFPVV